MIRVKAAPASGGNFICRSLFHIRLAVRCPGEGNAVTRSTMIERSCPADGRSGASVPGPERNDRLRGRIEDLIAERAVPGIQYLVVDAAGILGNHAAGWADVAGRRPMEPGTTMMLYSMTKTFTAAAVLHLVEAGRVGLEDPVRTHVPSIPYGDAVTVRRLLSQTSGIPNPIPLKWVHAAEEHPQFDEPAALDAVLRGNRNLKFAPGTRYGYSNIGYWLLGRVVERAGGMAFEAFLRKNLFDRLGMASSEIGLVIPSPPRHAKGYLPKYSFLNLAKPLLMDPRFFGPAEDRWLQIRDHYPNGPAFGGIVASGRALAAFLQDQLRERPALFSRETRALFHQQQKNTAGEPVPMTLGWHIGASGSRRFLYKEGGGGGFHGAMRIYPAEGIAAMVIANDATFRAGRFLDAVDGEFMG